MILTELPFPIRPPKVIDSDDIDWLVFRCIHRTERFAEGGFKLVLDAFIVIVDKTAETLQILTPVVVGVRHILVAILVSAADGVEVGEVARVRDDRDGNDRESSTGEEDAKRSVCRRLFALAFQDVEDRLGYEHIDEGEDREEVAVADVQVTGDADVAVEEDEEHHHVLSNPLTE